MPDTERPWDVLLIGGASGTGKSTAASALARRFGVALAEVDDFTLVLERLTTPEQLPTLHFWPTHPEAVRWPAEDILEQHLAVARFLTPALEAVVARRLEERTPLVLEGDYLLPSLAAQARFAGLPAGSRVRAVFLTEADERQIMRNFLGREPEAGEQDKRAQVSWRYGQWLEDEARHYGLAALPARPWDTLPERILSATGKVVVQ